MTPLNGPDDDDQDLPSYESTLRPSVEDEGVEMNEGWQQTNPISQDWSFDNLGEKDLASDAASNEVQLDSSDDERGQSQTSSVDDVDMAMSSPDDRQNGAPVGVKTVHTVPTAPPKQGSDDVTEIHVEGEPNSRLD